MFLNAMDILIFCQKLQKSARFFLPRRKKLVIANGQPSKSMLMIGRTQRGEIPCFGVGCGRIKELLCSFQNIVNSYIIFVS